MNLDNCLAYLILVGDLLICQAGDYHLVVYGLPYFVLGPLAGFAGVEEVSEGLIVNFDKTRCKGELR